MEFIPQFLLLFLFIAFNAFFVASEVSLIKVRRTRIDILAKKSKAAALVQKALITPSWFISSTQFGITLSSLMLGWIGEPIASKFIEKYITFIPSRVLFISSQAIAIAFGFAAITFLQIVLGELIPKYIALQKPETVSLINIAPLTVFLSIFKPIIWIFSATANSAMKILRISPSSKSNLSKEEIKIILAQSAASGALNNQEVEMIYKIFHFSDATAQSMMIHTTMIVALNELTTVAEAIRKVNLKFIHSRFPVYQYSINNIVGYVHIVDLHKAIFAGQENDTLSDLGIIRQTECVNIFTPIYEILLTMRRIKAHLVIVQDDKKKTVGIISIEDIIQNLAGDIKEQTT